MKWPVFAALLVAAVVAAFWAGSRHGRSQAGSQRSSGGRQILYYVDPMNPAHTSDKPGKAPCGMDMEPVFADSSVVPATVGSAEPTPPGTLKVSLERQQRIGVRIGVAEQKPLQHTLRLLGRVTPDETRVYRINAAVDGWITDCRPYASGSLVKRGEALASFYSPEFLGATRAFIFALGSRDRVQAAASESGSRTNQAPFEANVQQYIDSLKNLGMGEAQVERMRQSRTFDKNVDIVAPADGFITVRNVSGGQRFEKGTELYRLADLSRVWILVDVFERDAGLVQPDRPVKVELPNQGKTFTATVSTTLPQFDNVTRTLKLRLEADNPEFALKPDMFVDVELPLSLAEAIVVPAEAVLDAGLRQTVFVDRGQGYFEPRRVYLGARVGEQVQVTQGLMPGERIVVSGNFLLDSESRMKLASSGLRSAPATDPVCGMTVDEAVARATKLTSEHQDKSWFFCNESCKKQFDAAPGKYAGAK